MNIDFDVMTFHFSHLALAYAMAFPLGYNRECSTLGSGLRTYPLVAVASCGYALVGMSILDSTDAEAKLLSGIITGIGFIGGGAIVKSSGSASGLSSAAGIWNTGLIGIAIAFGRYEIALLISIINFLTFKYIKQVLPDSGSKPKENSNA